MHDLLKAHGEEHDNHKFFDIYSLGSKVLLRVILKHRDRALLKRWIEEERKRWVEIYDKRDMSTETDEETHIENNRTQNIANIEIGRLDDLIKQLN